MNRSLKQILKIIREYSKKGNKGLSNSNRIFARKVRSVRKMTLKYSMGLNNSYRTFGNKTGLSGLKELICKILDNLSITNLYKHSAGASILINEVNKDKLKRKKLNISYTDNPNISLIILSFNHRKNIKSIIKSLRFTNAQEIIVCEDGSIDGSLEEWLKYLHHPNDFLIRSNDLHEIRSYDRAINLARGEIVCILQDDDIPPKDNDWIRIPLELFKEFPKLAIIGGHQGRGFGIYRFRYGYNKQPIPYLDPIWREPFMFVLGVNVGPIFYRKKTYEQIGGFDYTYSKPGEPGIVFDHEFCLRAWLNGWQVGLYESKGFKKNVGAGATKTFSKTERENNKKKNQERFMNTYGDKIEHYYKVTEDLNNSLLVTK